MKDVKKFYSLLLLSILFSGSVSAEEASTQVRGYAKTWGIWTDSIPDQGLLPIPIDSMWESQNAFRIMLDHFPEKRNDIDVSLQLHYEVQPLFQSDTSLMAGLTPLSSFAPAQDRYRLSNPDPILIKNGDKSDIYQNLDRLNIQLGLAESDITIGRQAVALGAARTINPTDIFVPYSVTTLNQEYRQGVDALRYQHALGDFTELDAGFVAGHHGRDNGAWTQLLFPVGPADISAIVARANEDWLFGGGIQGSAGDSGVWLEAAQLRGKTDTYNRYTAGLDRSLSDDVYVQVEYHYNGPGSTDPANYALLPNTTPWQEHGVFLLGKEYLIPAVSWQVSPLISSGGQALLNLHDGSWLFSANFEFSISENFYADAGAYFFYGKSLERNLPLVIIPHSEFGSSANSVYGSLRYYF